MVLTLAEYATENMEETLYCPLFANEAFATMQKIRRQGKMCDITIKVGNSRFTAHRIVLAGTIPYFTSMLTSDMIEADKDEISIQGRLGKTHLDLNKFINNIVCVLFFACMRKKYTF